MPSTPVDTEHLSALAETLAAMARDFGARGWTPATSSNFSVRLDAEHCAVTISGRDKARLTPDDLMVVSLDGRALAPWQDQTPSAEAGLHLALYRRTQRTGAVLHTHSPNSILAARLLAQGRDTIRLSGYELLKAFSDIDTHAASVDIPVLDNSQDIEALARTADQRLDALTKVNGCWSYLIRDHGIYVWGEDPGAAQRHLEAIDYLLGIELQLLRFKGDAHGLMQH